MKRYLVDIEGTAVEIAADGRPAWRFVATRAVKADSEATAKAAAIGRVAREWAANSRELRGRLPRFRVVGARETGWLEAWRRGRGGFVFGAVE
ncbi:MAG TPA: hypothetical protein VGE57_04440 [Solimonas sp.]